jgi:DnaJ-class molecular chaperone
MIRAGVLEAPTVTELATCPDCGGNGEIGHRVFGHDAPEPFVWSTCAGCRGEGMVPAALVIACEQCDTTAWADRVCTHQIGNLCADHTPRCLDCIDDRGGVDR